MTILACTPKATFYQGRLSSSRQVAPIEPAWIGRLFFGGLGLALILEGFSRVRHH